MAKQSNAPTLRDRTHLQTKLFQRGLFFRSWYLDRPVMVLASANETVERSAEALGNGVSSFDGAIALALDLPNENAFFKLIGNIDLRFAGLIVGGAIDVAALLAAFPHRRVRAFKHEKAFPFPLIQCEDQEAEVAVVGELPLPEWPRIGLTIPVVENAVGARRTALALLSTYPGVLDIAVVANGSSDDALSELMGLEGEACEHVWIVRHAENLGFAGGANAGLQELWTSAWYDLFGVVHDDILPSFNAISELTDAFSTLKNLGQTPGAIGPVSNRDQGVQLCDDASYGSVDEFEAVGAKQFSGYRRSAEEAERIGSHFLLIDSDALSDVGGFDLIFGRGFFSDDDWCVRAKLCGYRIWVAPGAVVHHDSAVTFNALAADAESTVARNRALFLEKWRQNRASHDQNSDDFTYEPRNVFLPLAWGSDPIPFSAVIHGESVDLVSQASSAEFAKFVSERLGQLPRDAREQVLKALRDAEATKPVD